MLLLARPQQAEALPHVEKACTWDRVAPALRYQFAMMFSQMGRMEEALLAILPATLSHLSLTENRTCWRFQLLVFGAYEQSLFGYETVCGMPLPR